MLRLLKTLLFTFVFCHFSYAQKTISGALYPLTDFRQPLNISPVALSGSFGELRNNHFHSGTDFRTNQREGFPVFAVSNGYISRIRVQNSGFGLSVYINHPNGFTSVYAHLQKFNTKLAQFIKQAQYGAKSYEVDLFPRPSDFPVNKSEIIGYSGNTGSSGGPHLHFEVRDTKTEEPINSNLCGISAIDNTKPTITGLYVYRLNGKPFTDLTPKQYFQVAGTQGNYYVKGVSTIRLFGEVGFGIIANDRHNGNSGLNGVYSIELKVNNQSVFKSSFERFSFEHTRGINSYLDYPGKLRLGVNIQKSFKDPGNPVKIFSELINNGRLNFSDKKIYTVEYIVSDAHNNKSTLKFNVQSDEQAVLNHPTIPEGVLFAYNKANEYNNEDLKVKLGLNVLYDDIQFVYNRKVKPNNTFNSPIHQIHNPRTPVHDGFDIWIKPDSSVGTLMNKAVIVNGSGASQGGTSDGIYIKANVRAFGDYSIKLDTIAPTITPINVVEGKDMRSLPKIFFRIRDNLSGIKNFNGYLNGNWTLMEFDTKTAQLWHTFDENLGSGKHHLEVVVEDMKGNIKRYNVNFNR